MSDGHGSASSNTAGGESSLLLLVMRFVGRASTQERTREL